jgi:PEP-CTERM motif
LADSFADVSSLDPLTLPNLSREEQLRGAAAPPTQPSTTARTYHQKENTMRTQPTFESGTAPLSRRFFANLLTAWHSNRDGEWKLGAHRWLAAVLPIVLLCVTANATVYLEDSNAQLWASASPTGPFNLIGPTGFQMTDIALTPNGTLYGVDYTSLYTISPATGASTWVGTITGASATLNALVSGPTGQLYAAGGSSLYTLSPTGAAAVIGTGPYDSSGDLEYISGSLYLTSAFSDDLYRIPVASPNSPVFVGSIGVPNIYGLAYVNNTLYGYTGNGTVLSIGTSDASSTILATGPGTWGATVTGATPEPSSLLLLGSGVLALGGFLRRRFPG